MSGQAPRSQHPVGPKDSRRPQPPRPEPADRPQSGALPTSLWIAIAALVAITLFVIVSLFVGDVPARGGRITVTVLYFAVFVGVLIWMLRWGDRDREFSVPLAVAGNIYAVAYGLVLVWVAPPTRFGSLSSTASENLGAAVGLLIPLWAFAILPAVAARVLIRLARSQELLRALAFAISVLVGVLALMLFIPTLLDLSFGVSMGDLFAKVQVSLVMLTLLAISLFALLLWFFRQQQSTVAAPSASAEQTGLAEPSPQETRQPAASVAQTLPWPLAEDGVTPLPAGADGRPDFGVLRPFDGRQEPVREGDPEATAAVDRAWRSGGSGPLG